MKLISTSLCLIICLEVSAQTGSTKTGSIKLSSIGEVTRTFQDKTRSNWLGTGPRTVDAIIWYPTDGGGTTQQVQEGDRQLHLAANGNISAAHKKYPLIVISHGANQRAVSMRWLGYYLSQRGYVTVSIEHNGTDAEERKTGFITLSDFCNWERPQDISFVLTSILNDPTLSKRIDHTRIGAAGFSLGGAACIWAVGAQLDLDSLQLNAPPPPQELNKSIQDLILLTKTDSIVKKSVSHAEDLFRDKRIKGVFALGPPIGFGFPKANLRKVTTPVKIVAGDKDVISPLLTNAKRYADNIPNATMTILPGERGHYITPISDVKRNEELDEVSQLAVDFFTSVLK